MNRKEAEIKAHDHVHLEMTWPAIVDECEKRSIAVGANRAYVKKKLIHALAEEYMKGNSEESTIKTRFIVGHRVQLDSGRYRIDYCGELVAKGKCDLDETPQEVFMRAMAADPDIENVGKPLYNVTLSFLQQTARYKMHTVFARWALLEISASDANIDSYWLKYKPSNAAHTRIYQFAYKKPQVLVVNGFERFGIGQQEKCKNTGIVPFAEMEQYLKAKGSTYYYL